MKAWKITFSEYGLPSNIVSDTGINVNSEPLQKAQHLTCSIIIMWPPEQWKNTTMKKCAETNADIYMSLLLVGSTPVSPELPSLAMYLFIRPARELLLRFSRPPTMCDNDE